MKFRSLLAAFAMAFMGLVAVPATANAATCGTPNAGHYEQSWTQDMPFTIEDGSNIVEQLYASTTVTVMYQTCDSGSALKVLPYRYYGEINWGTEQVPYTWLLDTVWTSPDDNTIGAMLNVHALDANYSYDTFVNVNPAHNSELGGGGYWRSTFQGTIDTNGSWLLKSKTPVWNFGLLSSGAPVVVNDGWAYWFTSSSGSRDRQFRPATDPWFYGLGKAKTPPRHHGPVVR
jgi:hypothetical protein